jgi:hypothetical protein
LIGLRMPHAGCSDRVLVDPGRKSTGLWLLYWRDRDLRFHEYDRAPATVSVEDLLAEVDLDPTAIFWG